MRGSGSLTCNLYLHPPTSTPQGDIIFPSIELTSRGILNVNLRQTCPSPDEFETPETVSEPEQSKMDSEFAYEHDLRDYLAKNLHLIEPGLKLYQDEGMSGIQFPNRRSQHVLHRLVRSLHLPTQQHLSSTEIG